ncbi:glycosyltransferase family 2 protein [Spirulina major CS-329]|uniref:glycosyltransferase n=1 Tax=Spirulina TaxID=1154 RepID=UPI00232C1E6A|nr:MULTISPECIES: glycosyltransferase family 2 protein [Spirulina]MDB9495321.1 glycosyltransferase family 2 protein [Spirulina subsalsa CS-330]MDB9504766.1 glycosyltransferase family 2 protein [Spirulina major CS-329]
MAEHPWQTPDSNDDSDPLAAILPDWSDPDGDEEDFRSDFFRGNAGRRTKAAVTLMMIWGSVIALHLVSWGIWLVVALTGIIGVNILRLTLAKPPAQPHPLTDDQLATASSVALVVAAKNEEAVVERLARQLCAMDYPATHYDVWIIDDASTDRTPEILDRLAQELPQLKVVHRPANAGGGKSGALNQIIPQIDRDVIAVFDADALVGRDLLRHVMPMFADEQIGAVQVRKAIANAPENFWTKGQDLEMCLDSYFQQQRIAIGGIGELRGNGQFVRRSALVRCGNWNEETITDDLDLTIRLHLDRWNIGFCLSPAIAEEGVTQAKALWHQRSRWAEGGYQRYLDYWRLIIQNRMGVLKTWDLLCFVVLQYLLPTAAIPDLLMVILRHQAPVLSPLSALVFTFIGIGWITGLTRIQGRPAIANLGLLITQLIRGYTYMFHWLVVMPATTARMAVRRKRLKWVKTVHGGSSLSVQS